MVALMRSLPGRWHPRAVLLDLEEDIGPEVAGHLGFLGYLPSDAPLGRQVTCIWYAARNRPDAPEPHASEFHAARTRGILSRQQQEIVSAAVLDLTQRDRAPLVQMTRTPLQHEEQRIAQTLELGEHQHLGFVTVELGLGRVLPTWRLRPGDEESPAQRQTAHPERGRRSS